MIFLYFALIINAIFGMEQFPCQKAGNKRKQKRTRENLRPLLDVGGNTVREDDGKAEVLNATCLSL